MCRYALNNGSCDVTRVLFPSLDEVANIGSWAFGPYLGLREHRSS